MFVLLRSVYPVLPRRVENRTIFHWSKMQEFLIWMGSFSHLLSCWPSFLYQPSSLHRDPVHFVPSVDMISREVTRVITPRILSVIVTDWSLRLYKITLTLDRLVGFQQRNGDPGRQLIRSWSGSHPSSLVRIEVGGGVRSRIPIWGRVYKWSLYWTPEVKV